MTLPTVFVSYSHRDEELKDKLVSYLGVLQGAGLIQLWNDDRIGAGGNWESEISQAMERARVAILLVTENFLNSDFILQQEVPVLLERRAAGQLEIFPVIAQECPWQEVEWLQELNVRPKNGTPVWRDNGQYVGQELTAIAREVAKMVKTSTTIDPLPPERVPFTNQEQKIEVILSSYAPPYHLLDAPAGYGKTELLLELSRCFDKEDWVCAYVSADEQETLQKIAVSLSRVLGLGEALVGTRTAELGFKLGWLLRENQRQDLTKAGLALLIDLGKNPSSTLIDRLLNQFIPDVHESLRVEAYFQSQHNRFRVVLAGRYLTNQPEIMNTELPLNVIQLAPFSYKNLRTAAINFLPHSATATIDQLSAHIMHISGGHPGCMAALLEMYNRQGAPPDRFIEIYRDEIDEVIEDTVGQVYDSIPEELREVMDGLGSFRSLNYDVLDYLLRNQLITGHADGDSLGDRLTTAFLLGKKGRFLRNDSTHRLLALRLHLKGEYPELARKICAGYFCNSLTQEPEIWVIEYLYQYLQCLTHTIDDPSQREKLRRVFFTKKVPYILERFLRRRDRTDVDALKEKLRADQEFRFTINYYLRGEQYNDEQYQEMLRHIDLVFAKKQVVTAITVHLEGSSERFTPEAQRIFVAELARIVNVDPDQVHILGIEPGSVRVTIQMSEEAVKSLISMYLRGDPILQSLHIEKLELQQTPSDNTTMAEDGDEETPPDNTTVTDDGDGKVRRVAAQIFLSYAKEDRDRVEELYDKFTDEGYKPWMDQRDLFPGEKWKLKIEQAIRQSDFFLAFLSTNSVTKRGYIQKEIKRGLEIWEEKLDSDIYLIPVRLEECIMPDSLSQVQWVNLFDANGWNMLLKAIEIGMQRREETN